MITKFSRVYPGTGSLGGHYSLVKEVGRRREGGREREEGREREGGRREGMSEALDV